MATRNVNLFSGGMDSFLVWALHDNKATNLFVHIAHKYAKKELDVSQEIARTIGHDKFSLEMIMGAQIGPKELSPSGIIPFRNAELVLCGAQYGNTVFMGVTAHEINSDKSEHFMQLMQGLLDYCYAPQYWNDNQGRTHTVVSPLRGRTKAQWVADYLQTELPVDWLLMTVSCYDDTDRHCGRCPSCFKRWVALTVNGLSDDFKYDPRAWGRREGILDKCRDGTYHQERAKEILQAYGESA